MRAHILPFLVSGALAAGWLGAAAVSQVVGCVPTATPVVPVGGTGGGVPSVEPPTPSAVPSGSGSAVPAPVTFCEALCADWSARKCHEGDNPPACVRKCQQVVSSRLTDPLRFLKQCSK